jgi:hypothetical protein
MKRELKSPEIYRNALAVYLNLATDNVDTWLKKIFPNTRDAIDKLNGEKSLANQILILDSAVTHFFFLQWLYDQRSYFVKPNDETTIDKNYKKLIVWIDLLYDLRNYWSHIDHDAILLDEEVNNVLLDMYVLACAESKTIIPDHYKNTEGINFIRKKKNGNEYTVEEITKQLSLTGTLFYACLFLDGRQINDFLESMEQSNYTFEELNARMEHRKKYPDTPYPENLFEKKKYFLYARDVYKYWQLRGHRTNITVNADLNEKEICFSILEYLKRCPKETLTLSGKTQDENGKVVFDHHKYEIREKDKFFDWALAFWDEEMRRLGITGWQWARHQTVDKIKEVKKDLEDKAQKAGRPYHFPRYQKVVFDIPQNPEESMNDRNDEYGFTYFLLKDEKSDKATKAMFRYEHPNGKAAIGLMGGKLLCSVLEWYFYKFPIDQKDKDEERKKFWLRFFHACFSYIEGTKREANKSKADVSKEQIEERIKVLRKKYNTNIDQTHQKLRFILDTWNQIISYGRTTNMEHANDNKGRMGAKSGYQELLRYLSLMDNSIEERRKQAHGHLMRMLKQLGMWKSEESYFSVINKAFSQCGITSSLSPIEEAQTIEEHFNLCKQYRDKILAGFEEKLAEEFSADEWRPAYEMRWLGLSDARTRQAAQQTSPANVKEPLHTNIVNVDNGSYSAVGLPRDVCHLTEEKWQAYFNRLNEGCSEKIHSSIYPSPNGCTLLIPAFYNIHNKSIKHSQHDKRLHLICRQDTVLSHIAYKKWCSVTGKTPQGLKLQDMDYQRQEFKLPVGEVFIRFYYRYFKQNRYQLPPKLSKDICELLKSRDIVKKGDCIDFNHLKPQKKSILTPEEQYLRLLSKDEQKLPDDQKEKLRKERFDRMDSLIFYPSREEGKFYFDEILQSYIICRRAIIDQIHKLEREHKVKRKNGKHYTDFNTYADSLVQQGYIDEEEKKRLKAIRNAAFHGDIPEEKYIPQELKKTVKGNSGELYFDYFGEGIALVNKILKELTSSTNKIKHKKR